MKVTISNAKNTELTLNDIVPRIGTPFVLHQDIVNCVDDVNIYIVLERWTSPIVKVLDIKNRKYVYFPEEFVIEELRIDSMQVSIKHTL